MAISNFIIWNGSPEIFTIGTFALRWYGLFFALGFLISQQILYYIYRKEGKPEKDVEILTIYMVVATIIGARLGHVIFYQPSIIWEDPLGIFLPFEFSPFRFTGLQGLASHGGAIGILFALWLYSRKRKPGQNYFQVLDRIVILVALTGALIRFGNFFNSEIIGKPTDSGMGVVFVNRLTEAVKDRQGDKEIIESIVYHQNDSVPQGTNGRIPLSVYVFFKPGAQEDAAHDLMSYAESISYRLDEFFDSNGDAHYELTTQKDGTLAARLNVIGIARHPAQLYESISCFVLFIALYLIWSRYKQNLPTGRLFGIFLIVCFGLRFVYEFLKENQESFENDLPLNMGQILSIPLVIAGVFVLLYSFRKGTQNSAAAEK
ncbi:prolipoprotein diacylglyceryl transferase [Fulvivirgaceae bacterium PWU4]|uniref:Phosphatidylglycerol--prolipoprotein diacylglyceryl transferase n=1 Tax=Chryseosolibacter histidini TaxID=2782349 RepID=A0AAP2DMX3_9BACT|nr:prolipoprotein diacylglyceryl transferase [Chryseosolibacter histidini]MBT1699315.1 prolipoprotein diacylglyceryl transferase [Chryseosolibacter histidini]